MSSFIEFRPGFFVSKNSIHSIELKDSHLYVEFGQRTLDVSCSSDAEARERLNELVGVPKAKTLKGVK